MCLYRSINDSTNIAGNGIAIATFYNATYIIAGMAIGICTVTINLELNVPIGL